MQVVERKVGRREPNIYDRRCSCVTSAQPMPSPLMAPSVLSGRKCSPHLSRQESKAQKEEVTL